MKLLVIEDEEKIRNFVERGLRETGYEVLGVETAEAALSSLSNATFDGALIDVMLPDMDGRDLCRRLRRRGFDGPVIMVTARDTIEDRVSGLDSGADDYLIKPFAFEELLARLRSRFRRDARPNQNFVCVGNLRLDRSTGDVRRGDREIQLSRREYQLLVCLMEHAGQTVTRTMISERVWDLSYDTYTNVIDVYIRYLRLKIDVAGEEPLIQTIRGRGYRLGSADGLNNGCA